MPLFIDRLPFHCWIDATRAPPLPYWTVVLPVLLGEPAMPVPPPISQAQDWLLDTGNRGEAFAWRHHLLQAGLDPDQNRRKQTLMIHTVAGNILVPIRKANLWLVSNLPSSAPVPVCIALNRGLPFRDSLKMPDPHFDRPLIGIRALRRAGLRVELDFANDTISVWTPDPNVP